MVQYVHFKKKITWILFFKFEQPGLKNNLKYLHLWKAYLQNMT